MELNEFISNFADQFEETEASVFTADTEFRTLDEWSSILALTIIAMVDDEYGVTLSADEMRKANTISELYNIVKGKL